MPLTQSQGQALAALLHQIRHDWSLPGINAAIRAASDIGSFADLAVAACRVAATPEIRTPALIATPGPHWYGLPAGSRLAPVMCTEHAAEKAGGCPECVKAAVPKPAGFVIPKPRKRDFDHEGEM